MSYDIYIGNAELESDWPGDEGRPSAEWVVSGQTHHEAPNKPDMTGRGNGCHPGYGQWTDAMRTVGLHDLWFAPWVGLLSEHPGCIVLTKAHLGTVERASTEYRLQHPTERAGMCECNECQQFPKRQDAPEHDPTLNFNMLRLDWMLFWMRWALANCERPAVSNR